MNFSIEVENVQYKSSKSFGCVLTKSIFGVSKTKVPEISLEKKNMQIKFSLTGYAYTV